MESFMSKNVKFGSFWTILGIWAILVNLGRKARFCTKSEKNYFTETVQVIDIKPIGGC